MAVGRAEADAILLRSKKATGQAATVAPKEKQASSDPSGSQDSSGVSVRFKTQDHHMVLVRAGVVSRLAAALLIAPDWLSDFRTAALGLLKHFTAA